MIALPLSDEWKIWADSEIARSNLVYMSEPFFENIGLVAKLWVDPAIMINYPGFMQNDLMARLDVASN
jgi:hypothetical protein